MATSSASSPSSSLGSAASAGSDGRFHHLRRRRYRRIQCDCRSATSILTTNKAGANHGRRFYRCRKWNEQDKCDFFKWFDPVSEDREMLQQERDALEQQLDTLEDDFIQLKKEFLAMQLERDEQIEVAATNSRELEKLARDSGREIVKLRGENERLKGSVNFMRNLLCALAIFTIVLLVLVPQRANSDQAKMWDV